MTTNATIECKLRTAQLSPETRDYLCVLGAMDDLTNRLYMLAERDYGANADKKMEHSTPKLPKQNPSFKYCFSNP